MEMPDPGNLLIEPSSPEAAPHEPPPALAAPASLPGWIIPASLGGLVAIAGTIVFVGWLLMLPSAPVPAKAERQGMTTPKALPSEPVATASPVPMPNPDAPPPTREDDPPTEDNPRDSVALQRRLPTQAIEQEPIDRGDMPMRLPTVESVPFRTMLQWTPDRPASGALNLIMPIEVARVTNAGIPHTIRRLQLAELAPKQLKLAVTPVAHDDVGSILTSMGAGFPFARLSKDDLLSAPTLKQHDVVFLTCADLYARDFQAAVPLRKFVADGGTLYASDLCGDLLLAAFPEFRSFTPILPGVPQQVEATVVESALRSHLGKRSIPLAFEAPDWRPAPFDPNKVTVCLKGTYRNNNGQALIAPLLVKFRHQKGTVIFTSFHHTKNDTEIVRKLLDYLVFAALNARSEARIRDLMQRSNFAPHELRPAMLASATPIEAAHQHAGGPLQFALGFEHLGAKLKLTLRSPSGQFIDHADHGLYLIEIPKAEKGAWQYTITPLELPYENFPITIAVAAAKS